MIRRLPIIPTLIVLIAVAIMLRLGFWQLDRMHQKEALLARYAAAQAMSANVPWPRNAAERELALYRHSELGCKQVKGMAAIAGRSAKGASGWAHVADCTIAEGGSAKVVIGWSRDPAPRIWQGGEVAGFIAPGGMDGVRLVASPPLAGLDASATPDPRDIPNNHLSYAVQWFLFAGVALIIYALAVRKRLAGQDARR